MLDLLDEIENTAREFRRGRAKREIFKAADSGAYDADWRNAKSPQSEIDGAPDWPDSEIPE